jgi:hypothetical protein
MAPFGVSGRAPFTAILKNRMQKIWLLVPIGALYAGLVLRLPGQPASAADGPRFTGDRLERPGNYREWVWLSSGLGMSYGPTSKTDPNAEAPFDNVFVTPAAYRAFLLTGTWPDRTMLVLEQRVSQSRGSINQQGRYQGELRAMEVELKDQRFARGWAFFSFERGASSAPPHPTLGALLLVSRATRRRRQYLRPVLSDSGRDRETKRHPETRS